MPPYRLAQTHYGDTLARVAARELNDANRWPELVWLNNLIDPYLTDDASLVSSSVLLNGSLIRVPSPQGQPAEYDDLYEVFERDVKLVNRRLVDDGNGDFLVAEGKDNLKQQLEHRIATPRGQLVRHSDYGCLIWELQGAAAGPVADKLGAQYVKSALEADYRVSKVSSVSATTTGDVTKIVANAMAISGETIGINTSN